jgi:hypothetical protein
MAVSKSPALICRHFVSDCLKILNKKLRQGQFKKNNSWYSTISKHTGSFNIKTVLFHPHKLQKLIQIQKWSGYIDVQWVTCDKKINKFKLKE